MRLGELLELTDEEICERQDPLEAYLHDCVNCDTCKACSSCENCNDCSECVNCIDCVDCVECRFCFDCVGCLHCASCNSQDDRSYCISGRQFSEKLYFHALKLLGGPC